MVALAATNSATPSLQASLMRSRLNAARRDEAQAQATVQELRVQVEAAETTYEQRRENVKRLSDQSSQTDPTYSSRIQTTQSPVPPATQELVFGLYDATSARRQAQGNGLKSDPAAAPVLNPQGQATGRIVNVSA